MDRAGHCVAKQEKFTLSSLHHTIGTNNTVTSAITNGNEGFPYFFSVLIFFIFSLFFHFLFVSFSIFFNFSNFFIFHFSFCFFLFSFFFQLSSSGSVKHRFFPTTISCLRRKKNAPTETGPLSTIARTRTFFFFACVENPSLRPNFEVLIPKMAGALKNLLAVDSKRQQRHNRIDS